MRYEGICNTRAYAIRPYNERENKMSMKKGICSLVLATALMLACTSSHTPSAEEKKDNASGEKVAAVDGTVITRADFDREMGRANAMFTQTGQTPDPSQLAKVKQDVLENLIAMEVLYNESQKQGLKAEDEAVTKQLDTLKQRFPAEAGFKETLSKMNMTEDAVKSQIKRQLTVQQLIEKEVVQKITIPEKESQDYYNGHPEQFKKPDQVQASHILITVDPKADEAKKKEAHKKAEDILQKLQKGGDFAALAKEFSQCPSAANGGDLGHFGRGQMVKPFEDAAFAMKPGEISKVVETNFGYHIIKVTDKTAESTVKYDDVKEKLEQHLKQQKVQKDVEQYIAKLKETAKIERFLDTEAKDAKAAPDTKDDQAAKETKDTKEAK